MRQGAAITRGPHCFRSEMTDTQRYKQAVRNLATRHEVEAFTNASDLMYHTGIVYRHKAAMLRAEGETDLAEIAEHRSGECLRLSDGIKMAGYGVRVDVSPWEESDDDEGGSDE